MGLVAASKMDLLQQMVALVTDDRADDVLEAVLTRERVISTGVGQGFALPHARTSAVGDTRASLAILADPVDYDALDEMPVRIVLLMAGPEAARGTHLRLLSRISRVMADSGMRQGLLDAESVPEVLRTLADAEARLA